MKRQGGKEERQQQMAVQLLRKVSQVGFAPGFGVTTETGVQVDIQQRSEVTLTLKVGGVSETVSVDSEAPLLQSQDASVQQVMRTTSTQRRSMDATLSISRN
jgi:hypothetical protein